MPPKVLPPPSKNQPNLFSFFNKPKMSSGAVALSSSSNSSSSSSASTTSTPCHTDSKSNTNTPKIPSSAITSKADDSPFSALSSIGSQRSENDYTFTEDTSFDNKEKNGQKKESEVNGGGISILERGIIFYCFLCSSMFYKHC